MERLSQHASQTDATKGFGGKFGVQKDRQDKVYMYAQMQMQSMQCWCVHMPADICRQNRQIICTCIHKYKCNPCTLLSSCAWHLQWTQTRSSCMHNYNATHALLCTWSFCMCLHDFCNQNRQGIQVFTNANAIHALLPCLCAWHMQSE